MNIIRLDDLKTETYLKGLSIRHNYEKRDLFPFAIAMLTSANKAEREKAKAQVREWVNCAKLEG